MKKYIIITFLTALIFAGCEEKALDPVLTLGAVSGITAPASGSSFVLDLADADQTLTTFEWSATDFGFPAGVAYTLQMDLEDGTFANPLILGQVNALSFNDLTVGELNTTLLANGVPDGVESDIFVRVMAVVSPDVEPVYSDGITLKVTPYLVVIDYPILRVPGTYQSWDPANDSTVIYSLKGDGKYEGYAYFPTNAEKFKYTDGPSWDTNWGDTGLDGTLDPNGDDIPNTDAGMHKLNVNINDLTHTFVKTDWGLVGDATGSWDNDQDMTFDETSGTLKITLALSVGEIKFRANDAWDINLGDTDANGSLEYGGDNIAVTEAGNYTVELILNKPIYTYKVTKN